MMFEDCLKNSFLSNSCITHHFRYLPQNYSDKSLKPQHPSRPRNPLIADVCFKGGYIHLMFQE